MLRTTFLLFLISTWHHCCHADEDILEALTLTNEIWPIEVSLDDGTTASLALKQSDGFLIGKNTPIWKATGSPQKASISYTPDYQAMNDVGDFSIWHDYDKKAAAVFFVNGNIIRGFVGNKAFDNFNVSPPPRDPSAESCKQTYSSDNYRSNGIPPAAVYPELLIVVDEEYARKGTVKTLQTLLVHLNAADMLFHDVQQPKIKLNIAHIIIPTNSHTTPWINAAGVTVAENAARLVGSHFENDYVFTFYDTTYDFIISLVS